jgi:cytoskeletal protein CcmA (bactofilin family)
MALMRKEEQPAQGTGVSLGQTHTILGPDASFDGKLTFQGGVRIDGKFSGEIVTEDVLQIGEGAEVSAAVNVGALILHGTVRGNVRAKKKVELNAPAKLYGDIETPVLEIKQGVVFEGNCRMENLDKPRNAVLKPTEGGDAKKDAGKADGKGDNKGAQKNA